MANFSSAVSSVASSAPSFARSLRRDVPIGLTIGLTLLAASLAGGVVVASPLGPGHLAFGAAAAVSGAAFGGGCAALFATSSFIMWGPIVTIALVQASLVSVLTADPAFAGQPATIMTALFVCTALAGILQIAVGLTGLAKIIKYVPHPVVAGFIDGVSASIFISQVRPFFDFEQLSFGGGHFLKHPEMLAFVAALIAAVLLFDSRTKKVPAPLAGLLFSIAGYYILRFVAPGLDFGATLGTLPLTFPPIAPVAALASPAVRHLLIEGAPDIVSFALAIVVVGSMQSLLAFRMAENLAKAAIASNRGLLALGLADIVSAAMGGLAISVGAPMSAAAFRGGGRTRIVGLSASLGLFLLATIAPDVLGAVPRAGLSALLCIVAITGFDRWSVQLFRDVIGGHTREEGLRSYYDLAIVAIVMGLTVVVSIVVGILAGIAASCLTFAINMSQPIIRRRLSGATIRSRRVRTADEAALLRTYGAQCTILQLRGVLFFGNTETLAREVADRVKDATTIVLDCRGITDIDATGANIIREIFDNCRKAGKRLLFCNLPATRRKAIARIVGEGKVPAIFTDLDAALEWIEDVVLREHWTDRQKPVPLPLDQHDLVRGLGTQERDVLASLLVKREFPRGATLATESEPGDRMWLIMQGAVDVNLAVGDQHGRRRIASLGRGTTVGEMALIEGAPRSASIIAAEDLFCWELERAGYETIMQQHPHIGTQLLTNLIREMTHRIRNTSEQLRDTAT